MFDLLGPYSVKYKMGIYHVSIMTGHWCTQICSYKHACTYMCIEILALNVLAGRYACI